MFPRYSIFDNPAWSSITSRGSDRATYRNSSCQLKEWFRRLGCSKIAWILVLGPSFGEIGTAYLDGAHCFDYMLPKCLTPQLAAGVSRARGWVGEHTIDRRIHRGTSADQGLHPVLRTTSTATASRQKGSWRWGSPGLGSECPEPSRVELARSSGYRLPLWIPPTRCSPRARSRDRRECRRKNWWRQSHQSERHRGPGEQSSHLRGPRRVQLGEIREQPSGPSPERVRRKV